MNTAIYSPNGGSVGIGFAIPSDLASRIVDDLRDDGKVERGWLGVRIQPVTPDMAEGFGLEEPQGALVAAVEPGSPAAEAGIKAGDVVLEWDGTAVERVKDLSQLVARTAVDKPAEVRIWRDRAAQTLTVVTGAVPGEQQVSGLDAPRRIRRSSRRRSNWVRPVSPLPPSTTRPAAASACRRRPAASWWSISPPAHRRLVAAFCPVI